ncbi:MAG: hypothetical protein WD805_06590 [Gaiellaceae bacterium]
MGDLIKKDELESAVEARRELGPEYEDALLDSFVEKVEHRLEERLKAAPAKNGAPAPALAVPLGSLGLAIPLLGIAGGTAGLAGVVAVCLALVLVNVAYALRR